MTPDPLFRGWRPPNPNHRRRAGIALLLGLVLVLTPFWAGPVTGALAPQDAYRYDAVRIQPANESVSLEDGRLGAYTHGIRGVECLLDDQEPACVYAYAARNGTTALPERPSDRQEFVHLDRFYEPVVTETATGARLRLDPVTAEHVLGAVSLAPADLPDDARRVVEEGPVTTTERIAGEGFVVDTGGEYRFVALVEQNSHSGIPLPPLVVLEVHGVVFGLGLLRVGQRHYDRWQASAAG